MWFYALRMAYIVFMAEPKSNFIPWAYTKHLANTKRKSNSVLFNLSVVVKSMFQNYVLIIKHLTVWLSATLQSCSLMSCDTAPAPQSGLCWLSPNVDSRQRWGCFPSHGVSALELPTRKPVTVDPVMFWFFVFFFNA